MEFPDFSRIEALLSDLDGTLVDTMQAIFNGYLQFVASYGIEGSKEEFDEILTVHLPDAMQVLKHRHNIPHDNHKLKKEFISHLTPQYLEDAKMYDNARECLQELRSRGVKIGLVTSAPSALVIKIMNKIRMFSLFDVVLTGDIVTNGKPDPEIFATAINILNVAPENSLAIEDTSNGIKSATGAGATTLMFDVEADEAYFKGEQLVVNWKSLQKLLRG